MGGKAPPPPNYTGAANQEGAASQANTTAQTQANRADQSNPNASSEWSFDPATGKWGQHTSLAGPLGGANADLQRQAAANFGQPLETGAAAREQAITGAYDQSRRRLDPQWAQAGEQNDAQLANEGLDPTSAAARSRQAQFGAEKTDAYQGAMSSAIDKGTAAGHTMFEDSLQGREAPLGELGAMGGLTGQAGYNAAGRAETPPWLAALIGQGNYGLAANQQDNQMLGQLGQAGGSALGSLFMLSDERLKRNIVRETKEAIPGVPFASWAWKHGKPGRVRGVIAQDVEKVRPDLVLRGDDGFLRVNYAGLMEVSRG